MSKCLHWCLLLGMVLMAMALVSCKTTELMSKVGTSVGVATGTLTPDQARSIQRGASAVGKAFEQLTPEQEYYIGRAVAATLLGTYDLYDDPAATQYINTLGKALALASDRPETFGGWHFMIMDTDEINAFAAPGGFVLISRGMLLCCRNEDELAAVLAHEIAHIQHEHGLRAIRSSRWTSAFTILGTEAARNLGGQQLAELTAAFEGAISDVTSTLVNNGYARSLEREADATAITIMQRVGYQPQGLVNMLKAMDVKLEHDTRGFAKTHPPPQGRIRDIERIARQALSPIPPHPVRDARFQKALASLMTQP